MANILVTGGTGFIGSHTVVALQEAGFTVIIADDLSNSSETALAGIERITGQKPSFYAVDVADSSSLQTVFENEPEIKAAIHFAASKAVGESVSDPLKYYRNNLLGMVSLLEQMLAHDVPHVIFSSSATVYGKAETFPVTEDTPTQPAMSPYGNTKQICEEIIRDTVHANAELSAAILRYFNPIGAHPSGHIGELPQGVPNNLMPFITQTAAGIRPMLKVFGEDYETPDGTAVRDYLHVVDLAIAHVKAVQRLIAREGDSRCEIFNLGTGKGSSVKEVIDSFERTSGLKLNYEIVDRRPGDVPMLFADPAKAEEKLKWKASFSLDDMTRTAWNWEKKVRNLS